MSTVTNNAIGLSSAGIPVYDGAGNFTSMPYTAGSIANGSILALNSSGTMTGYSFTASGQILTYNATASTPAIYALSSNLATISANDSTNTLNFTFTMSTISTLQAGTTGAVVDSSVFRTAFAGSFPLNGVPIGAGTSTTSTFTWATPTAPLAGQAALLTYNTTASTTTWGTLSAGTGLTLTQTGGAINLSLSSASAGYSITVFSTMPSGSTTISSNTAYVLDPVGLASASGTIAFTLPATCAVGDAFRIVGSSAPPKWTLGGSSAQKFYIGQAAYSSCGATLSSDIISLLCVHSDATTQAFIVVETMGNPTFTP